MGPVVPPDPTAGMDLAPNRYGGPRLKPVKKIAAASLVAKKKIGPVGSLIYRCSWPQPRLTSYGSLAIAVLTLRLA